MTELSEYTPREGSERAHGDARARALHPRLPRKRLICFYPMAKRREGGDNWYSLDYDQRRKLMGGHGKLGAQVLRARAAADHRRDRASRTGSGASRCSATTRRTSRTSSTRCASTRSRRATGVRSVHGGPGYAVARRARDRRRERGLAATPRRAARARARSSGCGPPSVSASRRGSGPAWRGLTPRWRRLTATWRTGHKAPEQAKNVTAERTAAKRRDRPTRAKRRTKPHGYADRHPGVRLRHLGSDPAWRRQTPIATRRREALEIAGVSAA